MADNVRIATRGATYTTSDKAFAVYKNGLSLLVNLQPRLPSTVIAVYEVPKNGVRGAQLRVQDMGGESRLMRLGL